MRILVIDIQLCISFTFSLLSAHLKVNQRVLIYLFRMCCVRQGVGNGSLFLSRDKRQTSSHVRRRRHRLFFIRAALYSYYAVTWTFFMGLKMLYARTVSLHFNNTIKFQLRPNIANVSISLRIKLYEWIAGNVKAMVSNYSLEKKNRFHGVKSTSLFKS